ncbi:MAG: hypothetical protein JNK15_02885, partial [Planctomycetes bacterium]|nr:hypothetical protein [Planctomycetota bacterium]
PAGPLGETGAVAGGNASAAAGGAREALDADRFASLVSLLDEQTTLGDLGAAVATLAHLRSLPLDGAQKAALLAPAKELENGLTNRCVEIVRHLGAGRVLMARALAQAVSSDGRTLAAAWFQAAWAAVGQPDVATAATATVAEQASGTVPMPKALPRGRAVRVAFGTHAGEGTIADSRAEVATVRLAKPGGYVFPTVPVAALEPIDPSADEAVEMAFAALQHDDPMLARLWQWVAAARRGAAAVPSERARLLAAWLR